MQLSAQAYCSYMCTGASPLLKLAEKGQATEHSHFGRKKPTSTEMASDNPTEHQLPKVDFSASDLSPGSASWDLVRGDVVAALEEYGCFEAVCDQLFCWELHSSLFRAVTELFELPEETKRGFADAKRPYDGYVANLQFAPGYQAMGIGGVLDSPAIRDFTDLMWPDGNAKFWYSSTSRFCSYSSCHFFLHTL